MKSYKTQGFLLVSVVIMYTILALIEELAMYSNYTDIINNNTESINTLNNVRACMDAIDTTVMRAVYSNDHKNDETVISNNLDKCTRLLVTYSNLEISTEEQTELEKFTSLYHEYENKLKTVSTAIGLGNIDTAEKNFSENIIEIRKGADDSLQKLMTKAEQNKQKKMNSAEFRGKITGIVTVIISILVIIVLLYFNKRQEIAEKELADNNKTIEKQKGTINTAVFNDVLTDTHNRMSFLNTYAKGKKEIAENKSYYFTMFDIDDFSAANVEYGTPSGDMILNSTAAILKDHFDTANVYRTGSDEFITVFITESGAEGYKKFSETLDRTRLELGKPHKIKNGSLVVTYAVSVVKKSAPGTVDLTVLGPLKGTLEQAKFTQPGNVIFTDLDFGKA